MTVTPRDVAAAARRLARRHGLKVIHGLGLRSCHARDRGRAGCSPVLRTADHRTINERN